MFYTIRLLVSLSGRVMEHLKAIIFKVFFIMLERYLRLKYSTHKIERCSWFRKLFLIFTKGKCFSRPLHARAPGAIVNLQNVFIGQFCIPILWGGVLLNVNKFINQMMTPNWPFKDDSKMMKVVMASLITV